MYKGKYIYCFIEGKFTGMTDLGGIGGYGRVYLIHHNNLTAAVSDTPLKVYEPDRQNALAHEKVIRTLMSQYNLVPCSFGNIFKSKDDLILFMKDAYPYIMDNLEKVKGKMELGLRILWKKQAFSDEVETEEINDAKKQLQYSGQAASSLSQLEFGRMVESQVNERRRFYVESIYEPIARKAEDARLNDPIIPRMVLNAAFLVRKEMGEEFDSFVEEILKAYENRFEISYTGPWPPYNFTSIKT